MQRLLLLRRRVSTTGLQSMLNPNLVATEAPPIAVVSDWMAEYKGQRGPLINMCQAAPSGAPHPELVQRINSFAAEAAKYGDIRGDAALRSAYAVEMNRVYGSQITEREVSITSGCNLAFVVAAMTVAQAGDAIMLPSPWYFNHAMALTMMGIETCVLPLDPNKGFIPSLEDTTRILTERQGQKKPRIRAIALVSPGNPTGAIIPADVLEGFAALCRDNSMALIVDETYRDFLPPPQKTGVKQNNTIASINDVVRPHNILASPAWRDSLFINLYSFSKSFGIAGYRLGAITAPSSVLTHMAKALDTIQTCPPRNAQAAVAWGLPNLLEWRKANAQLIFQRNTAFRSAFERLPDWKVLSVGAYFGYVQHPMKDKSSYYVTELLAKEFGVGVLPGSCFGPNQDNFLRFAFANVGPDVINQLPDRLAQL